MKDLKTAGNEKQRGRKIKEISYAHIKKIEQMVSAYAERCSQGNGERELLEAGDIKSKITVNIGKLGKEVLYISPDDICNDIGQARKFFNYNDPDFIKLVKSVKKKGVITPIVVFKMPKGSKQKYMLHAGERRWRAAKLVKCEFMPAIEKTGLEDEKDRHLVGYMENHQRSPLSDIEDALAIKKVMDDFDLNLTGAAEVLDMHVTDVQKLYSLLKLDIKIISKLEPFLPKKKCIKKAIAFELAKAPDQKWQVERANLILEKGLARTAAIAYIHAEAEKAGFENIGSRRKPSDITANIKSFAKRTNTSADILLAGGVSSDLFVHAKKGRQAGVNLGNEFYAAATKLKKLGDFCSGRV